MLQNSKAESYPRQLIQGRVLSRQTVQRDGQIVLQYYLATTQGPVLAEVYQQEFVCFCQTTQVQHLLRVLPQHLKTKSLKLKNFFHQPMTAIYSRTGAAYRQLLRTAKDLAVNLHESEIKPQQRFLTERFIALDMECEGHFVDVSPFVIPTYVIERARKANCEVKLRAVSLDFECSFDGELYSVGLYAEEYKLVMMVGKPQAESPEYIMWVNDEAELINRLITWFQQYDPDIIIGWAVVTFDLALLYRRAKKLGIPLTIGRNNQKMSWKVEDKYRPETLSLPGRVVFDGIDWLKAAFYQFDRFSLEFVAQALLGEGKAIDDVNNRGQEIDILFRDNKLALAHYNLTDSRLVWDIFVKTQLFDFAIARAQLTGLELGRVGASVEAFNRLYLPHLHRSGYVAPAAPASQGIESPGGYVMNSIPGFYKDILVLDFKSLYPSIIQTFLIDPKGLAEASLNSANNVPGFLGAYFSRSEPILPSLIAELSGSREAAKQANNQPLSQAIKIIMNSLYGVLGSQGCVFHDAKLASSITMRGHEIMLKTKAWIEELGYKVIYGDTDSTFVWLGENHTVDNIAGLGLELATEVTKRWQDELRQKFDLTSHLELEFENHFEQFFMPTLRGSLLGSKKRYVGASRNRQDQLEITFKGMEQVRTDWSPLARRVQYELFERMFNQQSVSNYLQDIVESLKSGQLDDELVFRKRLKRHVSDYKSQSIPHVKAAIRLHEHTANANDLNRGAQISYVMTINGAEPQAYRPSSIDYDYYLDKQLLPIAEPVFKVLGEELTCLTSNQLSLL